MLSIFDESVTFHSVLSLDRYRETYNLFTSSLFISNDWNGLKTACNNAAHNMPLFQFARSTEDTCNVGTEQGTYRAVFCDSLRL